MVNLNSKSPALELSSDQRREYYIEALKLGQVSEYDAIDYAHACILYAPLDDIPWFLKIAIEEGQHATLYSSILLRILENKPNSLELSEYHSIDEESIEIANSINEIIDGGAGSGNFAHRSRVGIKGGSVGEKRKTKRKRTPRSSQL